jgi:hypothetical protein
MDGDLDHARSGFQRQIDIPQRQLMLAFKDKGADFSHIGFHNSWAMPNSSPQARRREGGNGHIGTSSAIAAPRW